MTDIEKLASERYPLGTDATKGSLAYDVITSLRQAFIAGFSYRNEWVSVETPPEEGRSYLYTDGKIPLILFYEEAGMLWTSYGSRWTGELTHWQELPHLPNAKTEL